MKTISKILLRVSVLLFVIQAHCGLGVELPTGAPDRVGNMGDPARLSIEGVQTFTEGDIRGALQSDLDYLVAAHPEASLSGCLAAVERRIRVGYRYCGFPEVAVQARFDLPVSRIVVKVTEGPRFRCGALQVSGLKSIAVADFTRRFAEKLVPASDQATPVPWTWWKTGSPVNFTPKSLANCSAAASNTFAALGRFAAKFKVEIQPQPAGTNAALVVIVEDEGPKAILLGIELVGHKQNRRDDVINFLGLAKGMAVTQDLIDEKTRALTQSARFTDVSITPIVLGPNGQVSLRIKVVERAQLPPLAQSLSREEKTLLRLREWLLAWESRQDDLIIEWLPPTAQTKQPLQVEVILSPSGGIMARVIETSPGQEHPQDLYSVIIKSEALSVIAQMHQRKVHIPLPPGNSGLIFVKVGPCADCPSGFNLTMGAGLSPAQTTDNWRLRLELLPAAFTDLLYRPDTQATWQGDVLTVRTKRFVLRVEEGTGRLLEAESIDDKQVFGMATPKSYRMKIRFAAGAFAEAQEQIAASTSTYPDAFQSQRAYGSALGFLAAEVALAEPLWNTRPGGPTPEPKTALASALEKLLSSSFLDPLQALLDGAKSPRSVEEFTIPSKTKEDQDEFQQAIERIMVLCAGHAQELTPEDSWLQILLREFAFKMNSRTEHQTAAFTRLAASDNPGPIGCFAALHALPVTKRDWQAAICDLGLRRMTTNDFGRDYRMLLDPESALTHSLANLTRELGTLTPPEVEAIAEFLPPAGAVLLRDLAAAARITNNVPVADAIGPALDRWWETTVRGSVEAEFRLHTQQLARALQAKLGCNYPVELLQPAAWKATWSPDNKRIAFAKQGGGIAVLDLASRQVTDLVSEGQDPAWSPDGKFIAWVKSSDVWVIPAAGGQPVRISQGRFPMWSADSTQVIFHSRQSNQLLSARVAAPDEPPSVYFDDPPSWYPAISPDGSRIAFGARERLVIVDRATGKTVASLATPGERGLLLGWSPDGRQVAFGGFDDSRAGLWIFEVERGGAFQVAKTLGCTMPAWSPDGENLVFDFRSQTNELWLIKTRNLPRDPKLTNSLPTRVAARSPEREPAETSLVGKPVPGAFTLALLDGGEFTLPGPQNTNIVLLDFWATWCGPCRQVMPTLAEISKEYAKRGVRYMAVNLREKPEVIREYLTKANLDITVALDADGKMAEAYQVRGIPTMVIVDRNNVVRKVHVGASPTAGDDLRRALNEVLQDETVVPPAEHR
jgi:thiol-disulfide isomerase/thioredoxin